jgi:hypothetical protein
MSRVLQIAAARNNAGRAYVAANGACAAWKNQSSSTTRRANQRRPKSRPPARRAAVGQQVEQPRRRLPRPEALDDGSLVAVACRGVEAAAGVGTVRAASNADSTAGRMPSPLLA